MKTKTEKFWLLVKRLIREGLRPKDVADGIALFRTGKLNPNYVANKEQLSILDAISFVLKSRLGIGSRKPFPGFNPVIFSSSLKSDEYFEPTLKYLKAGEPSGPWVLDQVSTAGKVARTSKLSCALHVHVYYPDLLPAILQGIATNSTKPKIYLTFPTSHSDSIRELVTDFEFEIRFITLDENVGRDLGPFLTSLPKEFFEEFDVIGHLHTKKSIEFLGPDSGNSWFNFMLNTLVGSQNIGNRLDHALEEFEKECKLGMVFPDDPNIMGWSENYEISRKLFPEQPLPGPLETFEFPMGSFFLARPAAIKPILQLNLRNPDFPTEPVPYDGTVLHAIERLLGVIPRALGFKIMGTNVHGVSR